mgnify:FL=1|tara:strand:- start:793 stop:1761 length:969 start_codon:yes stop_codon:yes gene_type:complete
MKSSFQIKKAAQNVIKIEYNQIKSLLERIDDNFINAVETIASSSGRLIVAGIGKSANISSKLVATFNSTGQPAIFLHAADAVHGDLGNIQKGDVVLCLSKSGNTDEIKSLVSNIKVLGNSIISLCGNPLSFLSKSSDIFINASVSEEACPHDLAPTSSTTVQLVLGDALAVCLLEYKGFTKEDFAKFHPGGILGKKLTLSVENLTNKNKPKVYKNTSIKDVIIEISKNRLGATVVCNKEDQVIGIITDGDLRRCFENNTDLKTLVANDIMSKNPLMVEPSSLVYDAFKKMKSKNITQLVVSEHKIYFGIVHLHDIINEGIIS